MAGTPTGRPRKSARAPPGARPRSHAQTGRGSPCSSSRPASRPRGGRRGSRAPCSATSRASRARGDRGVRTAAATSRLTSTSRYRPVMLRDVDPPAVEPEGLPHPALDDARRPVGQTPSRAPASGGRASAGTDARARSRSRAGALVEEEERRARARARRRGSGEEPLVTVAGVVERQVADDPHARASCAAADERGEGVVAAEQRVDSVEGRRVVAVDAPGREDRRQVDDVRRRAPRGGRGAPRSRAGRRRSTRGGFRPPPGRRLVPAAAHRPVGGSTLEPR